MAHGRSRSAWVWRLCSTESPGRLASQSSSLRSPIVQPIMTDNAYNLKDPIIIVSGLPRSGTSLMMQMLAAGGLPVLTDNVKQADEDNPRGYFEFEKIKSIKVDTSWLDDARGKVFKMVSMLLRDLPSNRAFKIIFMRRTLDEVLASQAKMLRRRGAGEETWSDEQMKSIYRKHLRGIESWLSKQANIAVLYVDYNRTIREPIETASEVNRFLGGTLKVEKMVMTVDERLYRQRK